MVRIDHGCKKEQHCSNVFLCMLENGLTYTFLGTYCKLAVVKEHNETQAALP